MICNDCQNNIHQKLNTCTECERSLCDKCLIQSKCKDCYINTANEIDLKNKNFLETWCEST